MKYKVINEEALSALQKKVAEVHRELTAKAAVFDPINKLMDNYEVCKLLGISQRTLQHYRDADKLAFILFHGKCLYKQEDVEQFIESRRAKEVKSKKE